MNIYHKNGLQIDRKLMDTIHWIAGCYDCWKRGFETRQQRPSSKLFSLRLCYKSTLSLWCTTRSHRVLCPRQSRKRRNFSASIRSVPVFERWRTKRQSAPSVCTFTADASSWHLQLADNAHLSDYDMLNKSSPLNSILRSLRSSEISLHSKLFATIERLHSVAPLIQFVQQPTSGCRI